jgi:hypothetical protein
MSATGNMPGGKPYRINVANYLVKGEDFSELPGGRRIRNRLSLRLGGFDFEIIRNPETFDLQIGDAKERFCYTTDIVFPNVRPDQKRRVDTLVDEVTELLSFATMSQVVRFGHIYGSQVSRQSVKGLTLYFRPTLGPTHGAEIRRFLKLTWPTYHRLRKKRKLNVVVDYIVTTELPHLPLEVEMLMSFVTLECLKSTYAKQVGYKFVAPAWRRISVPPRLDPRREPQLSFETLLKEMLGSMRMRKSLKRIIQLRNHIIHHGVSPRPLNSQFKGCFDAKELIREYLLRLLNFKGSYRRYNDMSIRTII